MKFGYDLRAVAEPQKEYVAWYGAIVGTLSLALALYVAWPDRVRLKISVGINFRPSGSPSMTRASGT